LTMKDKLHPKYVECKVTCGCGTTWVTRSTREQIKVEICSSCHPFFTGQQKFVDTAGRVEKFQKKYGGNYFAKGEEKAEPKK
jgi:large subunit ribosomal protein L31